MWTSSHSLVPILTFHKVDPAFEWGLTRVSPSRFEQILSYLKSRGYQSVTLDQIFKSPSDLPEKPVAITFDDGYESVYQYAFPLLDKYNFSSTTFIITDYINKLNSWDVNLGGLQFKHLNWVQIIEMQKHGHSFGSHTKSHFDLTRLNDKELLEELKHSKEVLEEHIGNPIDYIAFPFGKFDERVLDFSKKCGYFKGIGVIRPVFSRSEYVAYRKAYYLFDTFWNLSAKLKPSIWANLENFRLRVINFCSYGTTLVKG